MATQAFSRKPLLPKRSKTRAILVEFLIRHSQAGISSFGHLLRTPLANLLTVLVIAVALALPTGLIVLLQNAQILSQHWNSNAPISLFLKSTITATAANTLASHLRVKPEIAAVTYISPADGLQEFKDRSGFGDILNALAENPLPGVLEITPAQRAQTPHQLQQLVTDLTALPQVDNVQLDLAWLQRLAAILSLADRAIIALGILLALGVLLIIGNTIRLMIQNHHEEIKVIKLVGGTDRFIRRPFLYTGAFYGLFGGALAWLLVAIFLWSLASPVRELAGLYNSHFQLQGLDVNTALFLLIGGCLIGILGAQLAVGRQLHRIEPS